ncbi:SpoIIE family protein phosphatase [PVC group bacterium]|nr:SpoIIE family protein phosphatase [PVC group bacterium]
MNATSHKIEKLSSLIEVGTLINSTLDLSELLGLIMKIVEKVMECNVSSLMLIDEAANELVFQVATGETGGTLKEKFRLKIGQGIAGWVAEHNEPLLVKDVQKDPRFYSKPDESTGFITRSILCVPMRVKEKIIGILQAINPVHQEAFCEEDIEIFMAFANQSAIAIENARMHKEMMDKQRIEQELDFARQIQETFMPDVLPHLKGLSVFAHNTPAREVSGDFYDVLEFSPKEYGVVFGDVSGKGVPSGLYMVKTISAMRFEANKDTLPHVVLDSVNKSLSLKPQFGMFSTMFYMIFNLQVQTVTFSNAGHIPPLLVDHKKKTLEEIKEAQSSPLGIFSEVTYTSHTIPWTDSKEILLFTDGIIEARNNKKEEYGFPRLENVIKKNYGHPGLSKQILDSVHQFVGDAPQHDDMTLVSIVCS